MIIQIQHHENIYFQIIYLLVLCRDTEHKPLGSPRNDSEPTNALIEGLSAHWEAIPQTLETIGLKDG